MRALLSTNDLVRLSFLEAVLTDAGIDHIVLDSFSAAADGSIGAVPRRLMVADEDWPRATAICTELGELP
jgi:hypothetical protein